MKSGDANWLARLGLVGCDERLGAAIGTSGFLAWPIAMAYRLHDAAFAWIGGSTLASRADILAVFGVCLLFLISPFVGTGINAGAVLLALLFVSFRIFCHPESRAPFSALDAAVLAFIGVHLIASGFSAFLVPSLKGLAKMGIYWCAYLCFRQVLQTRQAFFAVVACLLVAGTLESTYGIYQWVVGVEPLANWEDPEALDPLTRVYSTLMNPNLLAAYLLPLFPLALAASALWRGPWRWLGVAAAMTAPVCLFFTYSRGAYLGLIASIAVFGLMGLSLAWPILKQRRSVLIGGAAGAVAIVGVLAAYVATNHSLFERLASIFTLRGHSSNSFRVNVWIGVFDMVRDNWLFGIGVGNNAFRKMYSLYMVSGFEALGAYNILLEVLAEMGVLGLGVFVWLLLAFASRNLHTFWAGRQEHRWWAVAVLAGLAGTLVMGMVDTVFYRPAVQLQFWLLLAMTIAISSTDRGQGKMEP